MLGIRFSAILRILSNYQRCFVWGIESNHYVRDVTLHEDESRIRIKPVNFARLRSIALNVLRANGIKNVARALYKNALRVENVLS